MQISISAYQTQRGSRCSLTPICAGLFAWNVHSGDPGKARQRAIERLRKEVPKLARHEVSRLFVPIGRRLERIRLDLTLEQGGDKKHVAGVFPVVTEPRHTGREAPLRIAYHPLRPAEWFEIAGSTPTPEEVGRAYGRIFGPSDDVDELKGSGQDKLVTLRLDVEPPSIFQLLPSAKEKHEFAGAGRSGELDALFRVAVNQTARAANGHLHPGLPRKHERRVMQQLLCGAQKRPVLVVGPPGSGKSMLIAQAVLDLLEADNYASHGNLDRVHNVMQIRGRQIIAGMSYVGQWEARCVELLARAKKRRFVFWTDDLHAWGSIGKTTVSDRVLADFFRGPVARGELVIIGECTREQLSLLEHEAPAFASTFARLVLEPATTHETLSMLLHESRRLEQGLQVAFDPHCFRTILDLSASLSSGTSLPGRALAPLKAIAKLKVQVIQQADDEMPDIGPAEVLALFAKHTGLPEALLSSAVPLERAELFRELGQQIIGQDAALDAACDLILSIRARTCSPGRPYGVFLLTGPTGTGKTELAKCIADYLYGSPARLVRFDMGEFNTFDAPGRLIGDAWNPDGQLTSAVRAQPFCVLLFDEVEKAHPSVLNLMLQIFEDARLTDARGSVADFAHCVIIMTSNLGQSARGVRGFVDAPDAQSADTAKAVRDFFPPELFNRIDRVVPFQPLDRTTAKGIVRKELARLVARPGISERSTFVRFTEAVVERIVEAGYSAEYGARALKRYIDRELGDRLTRAIVEQPRAEMRLLWLYLDASQGVGVRAEALAEAEPYDEPSAMEPLLRCDHDALRRLVPRVLGALRGFESDGRLGALGDQLTRELSAYRLGDEGRADQLFTLDTLRGDVRYLTRRLESRVQTDADLQGLERRRKRSEGIPLAGDDYTTLGADFGKLREPERLAPAAPPAPAASPGKMTRQLLSSFARVMSFERLLERVDRTDRHVALVEVLRISAHHERRRFSKGSPGLLEWLVQAYASGRRSLDAAAVALEDGSVKSVGPAELAGLLEQRPRHLALRLVGPGVADFLAHETGCQIRRTLAAGPEIVRVRVEPGHHDPLARVREHAERVRAFEAGLEGTGPLIDNPEELLPVTRVFHFDPPSDEPVLARVEDHRFAYVASRRVRHLGALLEDVWLLAAGRGISSATWKVEEGTP